MFRRIGLLALAVATLAGVRATGSEQKATTPCKIICLGCRESGHIDKHEFPQPLLARELLRQAFLIAARDECGLLTRDATLREEFPAADDEHAARFESSCSVDRDHKEYCYELEGAAHKSPEKLWSWRYRVEDCSEYFKWTPSITSLAEQAEALSRGPLKELLTRHGWCRGVPPARTSAPAPAKAQDELWSYNEIAVLGGLRRIHAEIRQHGEAPELLAALAVGYANLGMLTENFFSAAPKALSARALLYAERLVQQTGRSSWALWHRAYVRAIVGMHRQAEKDLADAKKKGAQSPGAQPRPFWTAVVEDFVRGKLRRMVERAKEGPERRLARYLDFEAAMCVSNINLRVRTGQSVLEECPDCFRALDGMCSTYTIGVMRMLTARAIDKMSESLRERLPEVPGIPQELAKRVARAKEFRQRSGEVEFRVQLVGDLKGAAKSGELDLEPSLAVVGQTIEEIEFLQVLRHLTLERYVWAVPTDESIALYRPLCERHPYGGFVDLFSTSTLDVIAGVGALIPKIEPAELTIAQGEPFHLAQINAALFQNYGKPQIDHWLNIIYCHGDPVLRDELLGIGQGAAGTLRDVRLNDAYMWMISETSRTFPAAVAVQILRNWKKTQARAEFLERAYFDEPVVLSALADKYFELKKYDDAERCYKRKIKLASDFASYRRLAEIYKAKKNMIEWKATLEDSLKLPDLGLDSTWVQDTLAHYYMDRQEWEKALPYAEAAAQSYAGWAMETAARCYEMLGEWKKAETLMRAISERYEQNTFEWMLWCYRTGHGDRDAADKLVKKHFEALGTAALPGELEAIGIYYLLRREPEKALAVFEKLHEKTKYQYPAMHAAMIADALGKTDRRDVNLETVLLAGIGKPPKSADGIYARVAKLMKVSLPPMGSVKDFDFKELDLALDDARKGRLRCDTNLDYFVGVFLKNRGDIEKSRHYLVRCAQTAQYNRTNHALACDLLHEMKVPYVPLGDETAQKD
jgi:tetratricopeptide (TPR) repeat protein